MHVALVTVGTRGDAQPFVAVGKALKAMGHRVSLVTHEDHRGLAEAHGLELRPVCGSFRELLETPEGKRWITSSDKPREYLRAIEALFKPLADRWAAELEAALAGVDVAGMMWMLPQAMIAAERLRIPFAVLTPYPVVPTGAYGMVEVPRIPVITPWLLRALGRVLPRLLWKRVYREQAERYRSTHHMPQLRDTMWSKIVDDGVGHVHMYSGEVSPRPEDWPRCAEVTGYCFLDAPQTWSPPAKLTQFLAAGPPPVYVGFGSMTGMDPEVLATLTREALQLSKQRAVIGMGWGGLAKIVADKDVLVIDDAPHDWLFPQMAAVVHHGGAGTLAAALRAGKPSVITPFFGDQPLWARFAAQLGVATPPILKRKLTAERLGDAIRQAVSDKELARRASEIGVRLRAENGATRTAERFLHHVAAGASAVSSAVS
jgi:sterol 3beta-glucosyltransferase